MSISSNNFKTNIVFPAWEIIKNDSKVKFFYFIPWVLSIVLLTTILVYQVIYTYVVIFQKKEQALVIMLKFFHSDYLVETLIWMTIFLVLYVFLIPIFEWGLVKYIDETRNWKYISTIDAIWLWIVRFLPIFEYNNAFAEFKYISILNSYLFCIRFIGIEYFKVINYAFLILFFMSTIINVLFSYSKYEIILKNKGVLQSVAVSTRMSILNLKNTVKLYVLMFIINIKVLINFLIFLFFPLLLIASVSYITSKVFLAIAIIFIIILFIFFIIFLWYLTAVLDVFKTAVWYFAYIDWRKRFEEDEWHGVHSWHDEHWHGDTHWWHDSHSNDHWNLDSHGWHDEHGHH